MQTSSRHARRGAVATVSVLAVLALAACDDPAIENTSPPVVALRPVSATIGLYDYGATRRLHRELQALGGNASGAMRAVISTTSVAEAKAARALLIAEGCSPLTIFVRNSPENTITITRVIVEPTNCAAALRPNWLGDVGNSVDSLGHCVQASNLAAMAVDPDDLVSPTPLAPSNGAVAARAVLSWEGSNQGTATSGANPYGGSGGGSDGSGVSAPVAGQTQSPPVAGQTQSPPAATGANPLLSPGL